MEREYGPGSTPNTLKSILSNCKGKLTAIQRRIGERSTAGAGKRVFASSGSCLPRSNNDEVHNFADKEIRLATAQTVECDVSASREQSIKSDEQERTHDVIHQSVHHLEESSSAKHSGLSYSHFAPSAAEIDQIQVLEPVFSKQGRQKIKQEPTAQKKMDSFSQLVGCIENDQQQSNQYFCYQTKPPHAATTDSVNEGKRRQEKIKCGTVNLDNPRMVTTVRERCEQTIEHDETTTYTSSHNQDSVESYKKAGGHFKLAETHDDAEIDTQSGSSDSDAKMLHTLTNIYQFPSEPHAFANDANNSRRTVAQGYSSSNSESLRTDNRAISKADGYTVESIVEIVDKSGAASFSGKLHDSRDRLNRFAEGGGGIAESRSDNQSGQVYHHTVTGPLPDFRRLSVERRAQEEQHFNVSNRQEDRCLLLSWLKQLENRLLNEGFEISTADRMEGRRKEYSEIRESILAKGNALEDIRNDYIDDAPRLSNEERRTCEWELNNLADRLSDAAKFVKDRSRKYNNAIKQLTDYENKLNAVRAWFSKMDKAIEDLKIPTGDGHMLQSQIHRANDLLDEARSTQVSIDAITDNARELSRHSCRELTERLREDTDIIARQWSDIVSRIKEHTSRLELALRRNRGFEDHLQELEIWISDKNKEVSADDSPIYYAEQITERLTKYKHIRSDMDKKEHVLSDVIDESKQVISTSTAGTAQELSDDLAKLRTNFTNLTRRLDQRIKNYEEVLGIYKELKGLMDDEACWLQQLQVETFSSMKGSGSPATLEDACLELETLERLIKNHSGSIRVRIRDLKRQLDTRRVTIPALENQITQFEFRWDQLHEDALKRIQVLEESVIESKRTDQQIRQLQEWMDRVDGVLDTIVDKASPAEMDSLKVEFDESARTLDMLTDKISFLRVSGKVEAARRLEDHVMHLQKRYNDLRQKYRHYQIPSDFEPNLERCRKTVKEVEDNIHVVDIRSDDPDILQMQLDSCMKLYNILYDVQPDVENVIRAGRRILENGSIENGENVSRQILQLKQSFNDMGTKVTNGKERLERALRLLKRFHREHRQIIDWLNKAEDEISRLESQHELQGANEQMDWIRSTKVDIRKLDSNFEILRSLQRDAEKETDKPLTSLTDKINSLERRVEQFSRRLRERTHRIEEQQNQMEDMYQKFSGLHDSVQSRLDHLDALLFNVERYYEDRIVEQIDQELVEIHPKLEELRNFARLLSSQNERYSNIVGPDVDNLYRRLDECRERLVVMRESHLKRRNIASVPVMVDSEAFSGGSVRLPSSDSQQVRYQRHHEQESKYVDERRTHSSERRRRTRKEIGSETESTDDGEMTDDEFRKKYGRCIAYLQLIDKLVSKGALSSDASDNFKAECNMPRQTGLESKRVVDREMIERVIKETERTIHVIERKEPDRARKLREMLCRLEEQLQRIESKIDAQGSVSPQNGRYSASKLDKGVSRSTLVDGYDSSDFIYNAELGHLDDRSIASEPLAAMGSQRYSRFEKWNRQHEQREGSVRLQPLLRVRSLRAVDRTRVPCQATGFQDQRRFHSLERGGAICPCIGVMPCQPVYYMPPPMCAASGGGMLGPVYRERIVDKHIAYREQQGQAAEQHARAVDATAEVQRHSVDFPGRRLVGAGDGPRTVPVRIVHSTESSQQDYRTDSSARSIQRYAARGNSADVYPIDNNRRNIVIEDINEYNQRPFNPAVAGNSSNFHNSEMRPAFESFTMPRSDTSLPIRSPRSNEAGFVHTTSMR